jgi:hypothetical protein
VSTSLARKAWRAAADPARTRKQAAVLRDYVAFRRSSSAALRGARPRRPLTGRTLVISLSDFVYQLKLEGVLAKALQLEGFRPTVLTLRNARWAEPYFRAFGVEDFVYAEGFVSADAEEEVDAVADELLGGELTIPRLKTFEFHGAHVGVATLSSLSRRFQQGRISLDDPEVREALSEVLRWSMQSVIVGERLLDSVQPDIALFNEKGYAGFGSIYDVALERGVNVIQYVAAGIHWRDALMFKRFTAETRRLHPASISAETWQTLRSLPWTDEREAELQEEFTIRYGPGEKHPDAGLQMGKRIKSADEVRGELGLDPRKPTVAIFPHILWDANLFYGEDLFADQEDWLVESVRAACANPHANWIVKLHPANLYKAPGTEANDEIAIREAIGELPEHVKLVQPSTDINTLSLFSLLDYGITIRGTIGLELPCFGVPVLTAGTGRYSGFGFTNDSASAGEYLDKLARIHELPPATEEETLLAKRHAYALFRLRPFRFSSYEASFRPVHNMFDPLNHNLRLNLRTARDVEEAPDLREFGRWAQDRSQLDYLAPAGIERVHHSARAS